MLIRFSEVAGCGARRADQRGWSRRIYGINVVYDLKKRNIL
jgi:hypothetical protein